MIITFLIHDDAETMLRLENENTFVPHKRRTVDIELTEQQLRKLALRQTGTRYGKPIMEFIADVFINGKSE